MKAKKAQKSDNKQFIDEFEGRLADLHERGVSDEQATNAASKASGNNPKVATPRRVSKKVDETASNLAKMSLKSPKPPKKAVKKRAKKVVTSESEDGMSNIEESIDENESVNTQTRRAGRKVL